MILNGMHGITTILVSILKVVIAAAIQPWEESPQVQAYVKSYMLHGHIPNYHNSYQNYDVLIGART